MSLSESSDPRNGKWKVLTFGAGAIGTYIGGSLALAGHSVVFLELGPKVDELRVRGLRLDLTLDSRRKTKDVSLLDPAAIVVASSLDDALRYGPFDLALFALKSYDTAAALEGIKPFADKIPPVLCLSNGIANERMLVDSLGKDKVIHGTVTTAVGKRGVGDVVLERLRGIGIAKGHPLSGKINSVFELALLNPRLFDDAASMKWSKMLTNLLANPASAILDMTASEIFANRDLYKIEIAMLKECLAVMETQRIRVVDLPGTPVRALAFATRLPVWLSKPFLGRAAGAGRGNKMPSFHIDLHSGRGKSEVEFLHGEVVRAGEKFKIPTPVNKIFTETLMALTNKEMPLEKFARKPEKLLSLLSSN
ncbi:MAG TPA: 2-dehydropantoate 2-reductase [Anaerolineales bacterium]|nr:2-dehydropantoate 2-reductase [Anaerolineales bacterium]